MYVPDEEGALNIPESVLTSVPRQLAPEHPEVHTLQDGFETEAETM